MLVLCLDHLANVQDPSMRSAHHLACLSYGLGERGQNVCRGNYAVMYYGILVYDLTNEAGMADCAGAEGESW